jgi:hypothetical protein
MPTCFVMQPFDGGPFDQRYTEVYANAIRDAGLDPYRVDQDPKVSIPIQEIESGIRQSQICLAEITLDNRMYGSSWAMPSHAKKKLF